MAVGIVGPAGVTITTPAARESLTKIAKIEVADGSTGFAAFVLPAYSVPTSVATYVNGANATQTINVGYTNGGTDLVNAFAPNSTGYAHTGAQTGTGLFTQNTTDKTVYVKASATLTNPVYIVVEYHIPPQGHYF